MKPAANVPVPVVGAVLEPPGSPKIIATPFIVRLRFCQEVDMKETLEAIYENGLLRPLKKLSFPEGRRVRVTLEESEQEDETTAHSSKEQENNRTAGPEENDDSMPPYMRVRDALSGCAGEISEDIGRAREDRI
jgi:predicted DNA-binding antitoxin AbrB/MazE fold protein